MADQSISEARLTDETLAELGLTEQPFLENKKFSRFADANTQKTRGALEQNLRFGNSVHLFIGDDGVGKSVFLSQLLKHCKDSIKPFVAKGEEQFETVAFLAAVLHQLQPEDRDAETVGDHVDELQPIFDDINEDKTSIVLAIDDAHLAPIEEIAELINLMADFTNEKGEPTARLLLTGNDELTVELHALADELDAGIYNPTTTTLQPLDENRTRDYLSARLKQAGHADAFPFTDKAVAKISREAKGLPANINNSAAGYLNKVYSAAPTAVGGKKFLAALGWPLVALGTAAVGLIAWGLSMFFVNNDTPDPIASIEPMPQVGESAPVTDNSDDTLIVGNAELPSQPDTTVVLPDSGLSTNTTAVTLADNSASVTTNGAVTATTPTDDLLKPEDQLPVQDNQLADNLTTAATENVSGAVETVTQVVEAAPSQVLEQAQQAVTTAQQEVTNTTNVLETANNSVAQRVEQLSDEASNAVAVVADTATESPIASSLTQPTVQALPESVEVVVTGASTSVANGSSGNNPVDSVTVSLPDTDAASVNAESNGGISVAVQPTGASAATGVALNVEGANVEPVIDRAVENERWVLFQDAGKFTVQLATSRERGYIIDLAQSLPASDPVAIYPFLTTNSKNPVFGLLSGLYNSRAEATAAVASMAPQAKQFGVWIRPVGDLQKEIRKIQ